MKQGCPLFPYLFVLSVKFLANATRLDPSITTLILDGSEDMLEALLEIIEKFSKISGLRLNKKKTEVLWIGTKARSSELLCPEKDFKWQEIKINTIGV